MASSKDYCDNCGIQNPNGYKFCFSCGHTLSVAESDAAQAATPTGLLPTHTLLNQRYRVLYSVGQGGMGAVYMAQDTQLGDRMVAVKEMSQSTLDPGMVQLATESFRQEAHLLASLHHPNLPSIHDHFTDGGRWYLVMSFIEGEALAEYLSRVPAKKLPPEEVVQIGLTLCDVLDYLHTHQPPIIFRDLKPSNIMRTATGHVYLIDFGIARHFKPGQARDTVSYGSAGYSPPEQYGLAQTTERSDIYSLGATLYHLFSGHKPLPALLHLQALSSEVPALPPQLVTLITRMLDMDESRRPTNVKVVRQELQHIAHALATRPTQETVLPPTVVPTPSSYNTIVPPPPPPYNAAVPPLPHGSGSAQQMTQVPRPSAGSTQASVWAITRQRIIAFILGAVLVSIIYMLSISAGGISILVILIGDCVFFFFAALAGPWGGAGIAIIVLAVDSIGLANQLWFSDLGLLAVAFVVGLTVANARGHYPRAFWISALAIVIYEPLFLLDYAQYGFAIYQATIINMFGYTVGDLIALLIALTAHRAIMLRRKTP